MPHETAIREGKIADWNHWIAAHGSDYRSLTERIAAFIEHLSVSERFSFDGRE